MVDRVVIKKAKHAKVIEITFGEGVVHVAGTRVPPRAVSIIGALTCPFVCQPLLHESFDAGARTFPLAPMDQTQPPAQPAIEIFKDSLGLGKAKVGIPPAKQWGKGVDSSTDAPSPAGAEYYFYLALKSAHRLRRYP